MSGAANLNHSTLYNIIISGYIFILQLPLNNMKLDLLFNVCVNAIIQIPTIFKIIE